MEELEENPWNIESIYELQYFNCPRCAFKDHSKQIFINHAFEVHPESINSLTSLQDGSINDVVIDMSDNTEISKPIDEAENEENAFECERCGKLYSSFVAISQHIKSAHSGEKIPDDSCKTCRRPFKKIWNKEQKRRPMKKNVHDGRGKKNTLYQCQECKYKSHSIEHVRNHIREVHDKSKKDVTQLQGRV